MKSIFETLPNNVISIKKKNRKIISENNKNENSSSIDLEEEQELLKTRKLNIKNNSKLLEIMKQVSKTKSNNLDDQYNQYDINIGYSVLNNNTLIAKEQTLNSKLSSEDFSKNVNHQNINININNNLNFHNLNNSTVPSFNKERIILTNTLAAENRRGNFFENKLSRNFFNIDQADNFSILNSIESLLNTKQKFTNDFFADSNISFKNSFLKNLKYKTSFKNMKIIKNSFSQSTINLNKDFPPDISQSNNNFYRNSYENCNLQNMTKLNNYKKNSNYNNYNTNILFLNDHLNKNREIFDIDEEKYFEENHKNKTINNVILNHLNKDSLVVTESERKLINKNNVILNNNSINNIDRNGINYHISNSSKNPNIIKISNNNKSLNIDLESRQMQSLGKNKFGSNENIREDYKVVTEIIESIKPFPENYTYKEENHEENSICNNNNNDPKTNNNIKEISNSRMFIQLPEKRCSERNSVKNNINLETNYKSPSKLGEDRFKDNLNLSMTEKFIQTCESEHSKSPVILNYKNVIITQAKEEKKKTREENYNDSLFETKIIKFDQHKKKLIYKNNNKRRKESYSPSREKNDKAFNPRFQIHQNYNLTIINRREKIKKIENIYFSNNNKNNRFTAPLKNYEKINPNNSISNKQANQLLTGINTKEAIQAKARNKDDEYMEKLPEFSLVNCDDRNFIMKNKLEYNWHNKLFPRAKSILPMSRNNAKFDLKSLLMSSFNNNKYDRVKIKGGEENDDISEKNTIPSNKVFFRSNFLNDFVHNENNNSNLSKAKSSNMLLLKNDSEVILNNKKNSAYKPLGINEEKTSKIRKKSFDRLSNKERDNSSMRIGRIDQNHYKLYNHAVLRSISEIQKENLENINKKINEYVVEYNKQFVEMNFHKHESENIYDTDKYRQYLSKLREEILTINS